MNAKQPNNGFEYRVYGSGYHVYARVNKSGTAQIVAVDNFEGKEPSPVKKECILQEAAIAEYKVLASQLSLTIWSENLVTPEVRAALITGESGAAWNQAALEAEGPPQLLRQWAEKQLHPALRACELAKQRGEAAQARGEYIQSAMAFRHALERLSDWWQPEGPAFDATETRYLEGKSAQKRGEHALASGKFSQVLQMRLADYTKKYKM